jgi:hypothetical protein
LDRPEKRAELRRVWFAFARRYPGVILRHKVEAARVGWQIYADDLFVNMETEGPTAKGLKVGNVHKFAPSLTAATDALLTVIQYDGRVRWFATHPAFWTYGCLFLLFALAIRRASARALLVGAPLVLNWFATMAFCMAQNTRYFYASFLVLPFVAILPWTAAVTASKTAEPPVEAEVPEIPEPEAT